MPKIINCFKNKNNNYIIVSEIKFESDLFVKKKNIIKKCSKICKNIFLNTYFKKNNKKEIVKGLKKINVQTNEKVNLSVKILKSKKCKYIYYIHMNTNVCILKLKKIKKQSKNTLLNAFFYKTKKISVIKKKKSIIDNKTILTDNLVKIYFF
ncbi:hypothetical protein ACWNYO_00515 [Candidatus Vidania fulgoroideorum]